MRRIGLVLAISLALAPLAVDAQAGKAFRIGVLSPGADEPAFSGMAAFRQALRA